MAEDPFPLLPTRSGSPAPCLDPSISPTTRIMKSPSSVTHTRHYYLIE